MEEHDVVVIGAGHNGLIVAAYLAMAGVDTCVVERQDKVGGSVVTRELTLPGFKHDPASFQHIAIMSNPLIRNDELGLISRYGLKYIFHDPQLGIAYPDQTALIIYRDVDKTCESIAQFSKRDADAYPGYCDYTAQVLKVAGISNFSPPPPFGRLMSFLDASEEGREYIRLILSSSVDIAREWFESEQMLGAISRFTLEAGIEPWQTGTGAYALILPAFHQYGSNVPVGGSGALSEALAACIKDMGGTIRLSSPVKVIKVERGEAKGVVLEDGEEILARKAIVSNLNVKQLFLELLEPEALPSSFPEKVRHIILGRTSILMQAIALNEAPKYKAGGDLDKTVTVQLCLLGEDFLRTLEDVVHGTPNTRMPFLGVGTLVDPTRAPEGKHTLYVATAEPYSLKRGGAAAWDGMKQEIAEGILGEIRKHTTNMGPENILGMWIASPLDLERYNPANVKGDYHHIARFPAQSLANRPLPGWGQYRTPVEKLYMCGASTHPGAGVYGGGRATVQVIMEDLGVDFDKVITR